jgi:cell pole-organizing protein PopZ
MAAVTVSKSGPGLADLAQRIRQVKASEVYVGIPAEKTQRKGDAVNNAELLFIHSNGSPLRGIPARPVLEPSIVANQALISQHLGAAAQAVFSSKPEQAERELAKTGTLASNGAKRWFTDPRNAWAPNTPATIAAKSKNGKVSDKPLIDTGSLRRAITYVIGKR